MIPGISTKVENEQIPRPLEFWLWVPAPGISILVSMDTKVYLYLSETPVQKFQSKILVIFVIFENSGRNVVFSYFSENSGRISWTKNTL